MPEINFKCKKCGNELDFEVGKIYFPTNVDDKLNFEYDVICEYCGKVTINDLELTELGQTQVSMLYFSELSKGETNQK